jgi:hypothetical protein
MDVPRQLSDLTPEWLSFALGREVTAADITPIAEGEGFMGRLARLELAYAGEPGPPSLVAKIPTDEPGSVMLGQMLRVWEREARFYTDLAPKLAGVRTAACHYAGGDEESGIYALLLEDLSQCEPGDQIKGATPEQTRAALKWLARFHATESGGGHATGLAWLPDTAVDPMYQALGPVLEGVFPMFVDKFGEHTPPGTVDWVEQMVPRWGETMAQLLLPKTVVHADYRIDNLFFADHHDTVVAIDWQSVALGDGLYDVAYFLCGSLDIEQRRAIERDALATYGRTLREHGVDVPGDDELFDCYRQAVLMAMTVGALLMGQLDLTVNQRAVDLARLGVERLYTAGADLKVGDFAQ